MANTDEAREALDLLHAKVATITDSEAWREHLAVQARFHDYSALNIMWMFVQWEQRRAENPELPEFRQPAAFSTWKDLGRYVRKGEKALSVLAPIIVKDRENLDENGQPRTRCVGFRIKRRTFEVAQTEGEPLPENPAMPTLLTGEADPAAWEALVAYATTLGFLVSVEPVPGAANGYCDHATGRIVIEETNDPAQRFKTLAHEVAHAVLHGPNGPDMSSAEREVEAESTAFVLASMLGFDTAAYSVGYVATWASRDDHGACLTRTTERVVKCARSIFAALAA